MKELTMTIGRYAPPDGCSDCVSVCLLCDGPAMGWAWEESPVGMAFGYLKFRSATVAICEQCYAPYTKKMSEAIERKFGSLGLKGRAKF